MSADASEPEIKNLVEMVDQAIGKLVGDLTELKRQLSLSVNQIKLDANVVTKMLDCDGVYACGYVTWITDETQQKDAKKNLDDIKTALERHHGNDCRVAFEALWNLYLNELGVNCAGDLNAKINALADALNLFRTNKATQDDVDRVRYAAHGIRSAGNSKSHPSSRKRLSEADVVQVSGHLGVIAERLPDLVNAYREANQRRQTLPSRPRPISAGVRADPPSMAHLHPPPPPTPDTVWSSAHRAVIGVRAEQPLVAMPPPPPPLPPPLPSDMVWSDTNYRAGSLFNSSQPYSNTRPSWRDDAAATQDPKRQLCTSPSCNCSCPKSHSEDEVRMYNPKFRTGKYKFYPNCDAGRDSIFLHPPEDTRPTAEATGGSRSLQSLQMGWTATRRPSSLSESSDVGDFAPVLHHSTPERAVWERR